MAVNWIPLGSYPAGDLWCSSRSSVTFYWVLWFKLNKKLLISDAWRRLKLAGSLKIRFNVRGTSIHPACILSFQSSFQSSVTENWFLAVSDPKANSDVCKPLRNHLGPELPLWHCRRQSSHFSPFVSTHTSSHPEILSIFCFSLLIVIWIVCFISIF